MAAPPTDIGMSLLLEHAGQIRALLGVGMLGLMVWGSLPVKVY
jgi:hypothetical protein